MKIRNGFVSNSSSSSFIVKDIDNFGASKRKPLLNASIRRKLVKFGFKETSLVSPFQFENMTEKENDIFKPIICDGEIVLKNYGYNVSCNEMDVIQWLVKNNIGFVASGHYGHVTYLFHKNDKHVMVFKNIGAVVETYHSDNSWEDIMAEIKEDGGFENSVYRIPINELDKM